MQPWEQAGWARFALIQRYADDEEFTVALSELAADESVDDAGLTEFAARFGLDRLLPVDDGLRMLDGHIRLARAYRAKTGGPMSGRYFASQAAFGGGRPDIGAVVSRVETPVEGPDGDVVVIIDEERRPLIHVELDSEWDPRQETMPAARKRLTDELFQRLNAQLEAIAQDAETRGYRFPDTAGQDVAVRNIGWLYDRVRGRFAGWVELARERDADVDVLKKAVRAVAELAGVDVSDREL